jgi:diguanylate cyclase (GGDEF)-like protein
MESDEERRSGTRREVGSAVARRAGEISHAVLAQWQERSPNAAAAAEPRVITDILYTTEIATYSVTDYLERGVLPTARQSREVAASGKAPLRDTISLADLTKLYLYWRDEVLRVVDDEARRLRQPTGELQALEAIVRQGSDGSIVRMAKQFDIERQRLTRELAIEQGRLTHQAFHDALTSLPNRRLFFDRLKHALEVFRRRRSGIALLFVDIDDFKVVNDRHGHLVGDELLAALANRLLRAVREADTVARFGGDEFTILLEDLVDPATEASEVATRITIALCEPFEIGGAAITVSASVGAGIGEPEDDGDALVKRADAAMYAAKTSSRPRRVLMHASSGSHENDPRRR